MAGALEGQNGAIVIAGTGSICYGSNGVQSKRTGGCGHLLDDEDSAYAIGRAILTAVLCEQDGRGEATVLSQLVAQRLGGCDMKTIVSFAYAAATTKK